MRRLSKLVAPLAGAVLAAACGGPDPKTPVVDVAAPARPATPPPSAGPSEAPTIVSVGPSTRERDPRADGEDSVGVDECDAYLAKMEVCITRLDDTSRGIYAKHLKVNRAAWRRAASTPEGRAGLATGCQAALDAIANIPQCR